MWTRDSINTLVVENSGNKKLGKASTTYTHGDTCPKTCPYNHNNFGGCYGHNGPVNMQVLRIKKQEDLLDYAIAEAAAIVSLPAKKPLRLHTFGDCPTNETASVVSAAGEDYIERGQPVWTYTHAWKEVNRSSWRKVSVLASCETPADVKKAHEKGYATSITLESFPNGSKAFERNGIKILPCLEQSGLSPSCADCKICFDDQKLRKQGLTIGFVLHSNLAYKAKKALQVLNA